MGITIDDVAKHAGVSKATVSRVLNSPSKVSKELREKVIKAINELGYKPSHIAKALATKKTYTVCLLLPHYEEFLHAEYFQKIFKGINSVVSKNGYNLMIKQLREDENIQAVVSSLYVDGFIGIAFSKNDEVLKFLEESNVSVVLINVRSEYLSWVDLDNVNSAMMAVEYLIKLGHKNIAFIGGERNNQNTIDRLKGYQMALSKYELRYTPELVYYADYDTNKAYSVTKHLIAKNENVTAIFCCNDLMAVGCIKALHELNISVPKDISVVGFDDLEIAEHFTPKITTVRQPFYQIGEKAAELLIEKLNSESKDVKGVIFVGELVIRESCDKLLKV